MKKVKSNSVKNHLTAKATIACGLLLSSIQFAVADTAQGIINTMIGELEEYAEFPEVADAAFFLEAALAPENWDTSPDLPAEIIVFDHLYDALANLEAGADAYPAIAGDLIYFAQGLGNAPSLMAETMRLEAELAASAVNCGQSKHKRRANKGKPRKKPGKNICKKVQFALQNGLDLMEVAGAQYESLETADSALSFGQAYVLFVEAYDLATQ